MAGKAASRQGLGDFERTYLEKIRLAAQVIIEAAPTSDLVSDSLEGELDILKDRVEFALLLPEHAAEYLPWRQVADDIAGQISPEDS
jgi:hypothetical protein